MISRNSACGGRVLRGAVLQVLDRPFDHGERRAQLVADIGDEVTPVRLKAAQLGFVAKDEKRTGFAGKGDGIDAHVAGRRALDRNSWLRTASPVASRATSEAIS